MNKINDEFISNEISKYLYNHNINNFKSDIHIIKDMIKYFNPDKIVKKYNQIVSHGLRVMEHAKIICYNEDINLSQIEYIYFMRAILFHDIGKLIDKDDYERISSIIFKFIIEKDCAISDDFKQ